MLLLATAKELPDVYVCSHADLIVELEGRRHSFLFAVGGRVLVRQMLKLFSFSVSGSLPERHLCPIPWSQDTDLELAQRWCLILLHVTRGPAGFLFGANGSRNESPVDEKPSVTLSNCATSRLAAVMYRCTFRYCDVIADCGFI
ncbi:hypothetical protein F2P81_023317 [Scophthalmus maximus]|uniref:Uncharacterized protein n=1 Tax=Scophthalmus maximus TaxID=52904 RepID=A0A6A4RWE3_SCOMX|nr:hypothetical protein F2P81_023317 [Scophthalmus maximus]